MIMPATVPQVASALAMIISSNFIKQCLVTVSAMTDGVKEILNWVGIIGFYIGCTMYAYYSYQAKQQPKSATPAEADAAEKGESEQEPLLKKS